MSDAQSNATSEPHGAPEAREGKAAGDLAAQDYAAAMHEIESNLDVRRLMFVVSNVMVPALTVGVFDCLTGSSYPEELAWLPRHVVVIVGFVFTVGGILISAILARCHYGLVVNGTKMRRVESGETRLAGLNWLGVTTNFTALTALSAGAGAAVCVAGFGPAWAAWAAGLGVVALLMLYLQVSHWRANRLCRSLEGSWQHGEVPSSMLEEHARRTQDATAADVAVIVTMAAALFAGIFNAATNVGGIDEGLETIPPAASIVRHGVVALMGFTLVSLLLSARMVVRLRLALASSSADLARLRGETDDPYRFRLLERTFLLFLLLELFTATSAVIVGWTLWNSVAGAIAGGVVFLAGAHWYRWCLWRARPRAGRVPARVERTGEPAKETAAEVESEDENGTESTTEAEPAKQKDGRAS